MTRISRIFGEPSCQIYESIGEIRNQNTPPTGRVRYLPKDTSLCIITQVATNTISKRLYCIYGSYQTGTELHRLTAYATTGTELHRLTAYATTGTELHRLHATTGTELQANGLLCYNRNRTAQANSLCYNRNRTAQANSLCYNWFFH